MKITKLIGLLGLLSGLLHIWTFIGFGELRYFSLVFVLIYGGLGLFVYMDKRWALYAIGLAMLIGGIGATASFATNTLPAWIRVILIAIDVLVVVAVPWVLFGTKDNTETKELFFTTPLALSGKVAGVKRTSSHMDVPAVVPGADRPPRTGTGKGKSKTTSWSGQLRENPANGKPICYAFNSLAGCRVANCPREHICRKPGCGAAHSITTHNRAA